MDTINAFADLINLVMDTIPSDPTDAFMFVFIILVIYFLPPSVASFRHHHNTGAIFILTLLLGWTVLGWVAALVWASTVVRKPEEQRDRAGTE